MIFKRTVLLGMLTMISGLPGVFLQGAAWWDMAKKSGGVSFLSEAMFEQTPCERCHAVRRDFNGATDPERPAPAERSQGFRPVAMLSETVEIPLVRTELLGSRTYSIRAEACLRPRSDRPDTPPPRATA